MSTRASHRLVPVLATVVLISAAAPVQASFHFWAFTEIFSNDDGSVQFVELFTESVGQQFANGQTFQVTQGASTNSYIFPANTPAPTNAHHLLLATAGFAAIPGAPTPDFIIPDGFLFAPNGTLTGLGLVTPPVAYANIPTDGILSLDADGTTTAPNSPTNYNGDTASIDVSPQPSVPTTSTWGSIALVLSICIASAILIRQRRIASA